MLAPVTHVLALATIRRERVLPVPGRVVVRKGQKVSATDVLAEAKLAPQHQLFDVGRALGISESMADRYIQCSAGMQMAHGDVLAGPVGMAKRVLRAPRDGRVLVVGSGQILMEVDSPLHELKAGLSGTVSDLLGDRGAVVETTGAIVQGVWGNGQIDYGLMNVLATRPDEPLTPDRLDVSMRGSVIFCGYCDDPEVLRTAAGLPLRGLILGSMAVDLIPLARQVKFPVIVIEGWGLRALNSNAFRILASSERREASLNAEAWDRAAGNRPEVIINLPSTGEIILPTETAEYDRDQQVHLIREPYAGSVGVISAMLPGFTRMPSGISTRAAQVRLENGENVVVPLANLEILA